MQHSWFYSQMYPNREDWELCSVWLGIRRVQEERTSMRKRKREGKKVLKPKPRRTDKTESEDEKMEYNRECMGKKERKASHFDGLIVAGLTAACGPSSLMLNKNLRDLGCFKPTLLWTMTQGANFKYADWYIYSFSQSRRWSSFSAAASLLPLFIAWYCFLIPQLPFLFLFSFSFFFPSPLTGAFSSRFSFGADKSGMLCSMSGPMCMDTQPQS